MKQGSREWLLLRSGKLTGSCFAAALGLSPYKSRAALWRDLTGRGKPVEETPRMLRGTTLEPEARSWYECDRGILVQEVGFVPHPVHSCLGVSPDGLTLDGGAIEIKVPDSVHSEIPEHYKPQCVGVLHICGRDYIDFISYCFTEPERTNVFRLTADETREQWKRWEAELVAFYNDYVLADVEPPRKRRSNGVSK